MRPCWMVYLLLLMFVLEGEMNEEYFWNFGFNSDKIESHSVETDSQIDFNPSAVLAFVPARSCHLQLSEPHGTFSPPIFYGNIHVNLWCNWTILAAPDRHIVIYITGFQTNKSCSENHEEIIFEGVSSSVENTIVYACWNKHTHVFATKALAVSVVLLWRSISNTGSNTYFYGRYYVFNDPVLGPNIDSGNCSIVSKQNTSTSASMQPPSPDKRPTTKSHLDSVFPESSSSEMFSSIPYSLEAPSPQEPPTEMETYLPTLTIDHLLTTTTHGDDMLHVTRSLAQSHSTIYYTSESPMLLQSLELGVYEVHTVLPTTGDLEPSHIGKLETMSQSNWTMARSEFLSETPSLILTQNTKFLEAAHLGVTSWMVETQTFSEDQLSIIQTQSLIAPWPTLITVHATDPLDLSYVHILDTDFPAPSLLSDISYSREIHTTKFIETLQLGNDQTTDQVNMPHFSIVQAIELPKSLNVSLINSLEFSETISFSSPRYIEPISLKASTVQHIYSSEINFLNVNDVTEPSEVLKLSITNNVDLTETHNFTILPTRGQSSFLTTVDGAHQQMLVAKVHLTTNVESHLEEQVSEYPWKMASVGPTPYPDSTDISHHQLTSFTETYVSVLDALQDPSSPQSTEFKADERLTIESTVASHPTHDIPTELIYPKGILEFTEITDKMETINEYTVLRSFEIQSLPTTNYKYGQSLVKPMEELDWWTLTRNLEATRTLEATDSISTTSTHPLSTQPSYLYFSGKLINTFSNSPEGIKPQATPSQTYPQSTYTLKSSMDVATTERISDGNEKSTYSYQTNTDFNFYQIAAGQPRGGFLDKQDVTYFFGNESDLEVLHKPGDSLFVITTEIEDKDVVWKGFERDLVKSIREKITERMIYFPSGVNSLKLKEIRWSNVNKVKLTFWLQLFQGGKEMRNFLKTQLKALEGHPFGSSNAKLISFTVDDVNECQLGIENCHSNAHCVNMVGSYSCVCMDGYEDHSSDASGTLCISPKSAEVNSLAEHLKIVIGAIVTVAVTLLFVIVILCIVQYKRRAKVNFSLEDRPTREPEARIGDHHGELGQPLSNPYRSSSPSRVRAHHTARDMSSTLELTKITVEQASC